MGAVLRFLRRLLVVLGIVAVGSMWTAAPPAGADPARPTDDRARVVAVDPAIEGLEVSIAGGDAFVVLRSPPGREVRVAGYQGEPYLWIDTTGVIWENQHSPTRIANRSRLGTAPASDDEVDASAMPHWRQIGRGGQIAWHDHRVHWMSPQRPLGAEPGDTITEAAIPFLVDGREVLAHIELRWELPPSPVPAALGTVIGLLGVAAVLAAGRRFAAPQADVARAGAAFALAAAACVVTLPGASSLPTGVPLDRLAVATSATAAVAGLGALVLRRRPPLSRALAMIGLAETAVWAWPRRAGLWRPVLPSGGLAPLDRIVTAAALGAAAAFGVLAIGAAVHGALRRRHRRPTAPPPGTTSLAGSSAR